MHKCLVFRPQGRREKKKKKHVKHTRNAEMSFNSEPKVHIIYHYLEGDWEKAISKYFLAGAVFNSMSGEPEGLLSYISSCFSKSKAQKALHRLLPPEMSSHYLATRGDGIRAQEVPASWGQGSSPLPKRITKNQQTDIPRGGVLGGGGGWRGDTFLLLSQRSLAPWMYPVNSRGLGSAGREGASRVTGCGCPCLSPSWDAGKLCRRMGTSCLGPWVARDIWI